MSIEGRMSQAAFLSAGGVYAKALLQRKKDGIDPEVYVHQEYPKMLYFSLGIREIERTSEDVKGRTTVWTERKERFVCPIVQNRTEERDMAKTIAEAEALGVELQPEWDAGRIHLMVERAAEAAAARAEVIDPRVAAQAKVERLRAEIAALEGAIDDDAAPPAASPKPAARRRELPVVAPDPVAA